jgi:hypothetical protein
MPIFGRRHSRKASKDKDKDKDKERDPSQSQHRRSQSQSQSQPHREEAPEPPKHHRTKTAPDTPTLLRLPSTSSTVSASQRSRRATNPSTPTAPTPYSTSPATSASYFAPQPAASGAEQPRSPAARRPPASFSAGHDTSRGPPVTLITRGNSDYARRTSQKPSDYAYAQQQFQQLGLVSPVDSQSSSSRRPRDDSSAENIHDAAPQPPPPQQQQTNAQPPKRNHALTAHPPQQMASSIDESSSSDSDSDSGPPSNRGARPAAQSGHGATADTSGTDEEQGEDLFLHIAADSAPKQPRHIDSARHDKLRSRIARVNRMSSPSALHSPSPGPSSSTTPAASRIPATTEPRSSTQPRRSSLLPSSSKTVQERPPQSPGSPLDTSRSRVPELHTKASFSRRDSDLSPRDFLAQLGNRRRGSQPEPLATPPNRASTYRPSNLGHYSSSRDDTRTPQPETTPREALSQPDGTESHASTGPAVSVWDELDELKTRIRRIEMGGKIPATSGAIMAQASAERPRTANTSATTVSSSPNQTRKSNPSPSESTVDAPTNHRAHPLLREALVKARQHISPTVYRILDATASEALTLAEMTGSAGPQGTLHSASSILGGANVSDRQVRRKADNICRSLTELCIAMCDTKSALGSPAVRSSTATISRRPSVQINGDSPTVRQSVEPESNPSNISPSRALHRIEARRSSMLYNGSGTPRESSQEPYDQDRQFSSRLSRAGTSLQRNHQGMDDDDEEQNFRAPSRAMTDFRSLRPTQQARLAARQYTSREPMPELQSPPSLQSSNLRRPTTNGNENSLLFRDGSRRYDFQRESSPAYEKQVAGSARARTQLAVNRNPSNRNSIGGVSDLSRNVTLDRRRRGNSTGE